MKSFTCKENLRVDVFLSNELEIPRNQVLKLIKDKGIHVNKKNVNKPSFKLQSGDIVEFFEPKLHVKPSEYEVDFDVDILYEDDDLMVVNKPPNLVVHPAPSVKEATLVDWLKSKNIRLSTLNGDERHGIVHRIDKQTSGALVVAKTNKAHENLSYQLENKTMGRYYLAMIDLPLKEDCVVEKPIGRNPKNRLKMSVVQNAREAKSAFCNLHVSSHERFALIAAKLYTGRTHQIRVHLESISRHILGDDLYGFKTHKAKITRVMLHAYILYLIHPISKEPLFVKAPFFDDFSDLGKKYFLKEENDEIFKQEFIVERFCDAHKWLWLTA